jgi:hypothetical protein
VLVWACRYKRLWLIGIPDHPNNGNFNLPQFVYRLPLELIHIEPPR